MSRNHKSQPIISIRNDIVFKMFIPAQEQNLPESNLTKEEYAFPFTRLKALVLKTCRRHIFSGQLDPLDFYSSIKSNHRYELRQRSVVLRIPTIICYLTVLLVCLASDLCRAATLCQPQSWWDANQDKCVSCTVCQTDMIALRPCQVHRDTVCGSIYDLQIDWVVLAKTEPNWKERRKFDNIDYDDFDQHHLTPEQLQQLEDEAVPMDWQTVALFLAVLACLLFFIVAACILIHHMRQWRRMERRLDQDVEELSTRLMAKLAEVQHLEGGTFFIGNADALGLTVSAVTGSSATAALQQSLHVHLPGKSEKHPDHRLLTTLKGGNVYIEENGSK